MKIAVVSDSHNNSNNLARVVAIANEKNCSYLFHLGDFVSSSAAHELTAFKGIVKAVYGNCDGQDQGLQQVIVAMGGEIRLPPFKLELEGQKIILLHEPFRLQNLIASQQADFIFYGHLHRVALSQEGDTWVLNPGEAEGRNRNPTFFIVDIGTQSFEEIQL